MADPTSPRATAGDLMRLNLALYEWGGDCARRLDSVLSTLVK